MNRRECKPRNYGYLSFNLINNNAMPLNPRMRALLTLERMLLRSLISPPPSEQFQSMRFVRAFDGKSRRLISFWSVELSRKRNFAEQFLKYYRVRFN